MGKKRNSLIDDIWYLQSVNSKVCDLKNWCDGLWFLRQQFLLPRGKIFATLKCGSRTDWSRNNKQNSRAALRKSWFSKLKFTTFHKLTYLKWWFKNFHVLGKLLQVKVGRKWDSLRLFSRYMLPNTRKIGYLTCNFPNSHKKSAQRRLQPWPCGKDLCWQPFLNSNT